MFIVFDQDRPSDSPLIERVWSSHSTAAGRFLSVACSHWEIVVTRLRGETVVTLRGPETRASEVSCPADGEWFGIRFSAGTFMKYAPAARLRDRHDLNLPQASARSFWLDGSKWHYPNIENAETFVNRLLKAGLIARNPLVAAVLQGERSKLSKRSEQRHFLQATGMTFGAMKQIERARHAATLLRAGVPIADTVHEAGYFDQAHLTRSLRQLIGLTPAKIANEQHQLSLLYKTRSAR